VNSTKIIGSNKPERLQAFPYRVSWDNRELFVHTIRIWLVEAITLTRLLSGLLFIAVAFRNVPRMVIVLLYGLAICSDLVDGYLARKLDSETHFGKIFDLVSDKSLTIISVLYAAVRGIDIVPIAFIAIREIITLGARLIVVEGMQLLTANKKLGATMVFFLWSNTLFLVFAGDNKSMIVIANKIYWTCSIILAVTLCVRIYLSADRIKTALTVR